MKSSFFGCIGAAYHTEYFSGECLPVIRMICTMFHMHSTFTRFDGDDDDNGTTPPQPDPIADPNDVGDDIGTMIGQHSTEEPHTG